MNSNHQRQLQWYGTLKIIGGLLVLAPLPSLWGSSGALGNVLVLLASVAAFAVILRGWLALSVASRDKSGRWYCRGSGLKWSDSRRAAIQEGLVLNVKGVRIDRKPLEAWTPLAQQAIDAERERRRTVRQGT